MAGGARYKRYGEAKMAAVCQSIEKDTLMRLWPHPRGGYEVTAMGQEAMPVGLTWYVTVCGGQPILSHLTEYRPGQYDSGQGYQLPLTAAHVDALNAIAERIGPDEMLVKVFGEDATLHIHRPWEQTNGINYLDPQSVRQHCWPRLWGGETRWKAYRKGRDAR